MTREKTPIQPLLYIEQPFFQIPHVTMQRNYRTLKQEEQKQNLSVKREVENEEELEMSHDKKDEKVENKKFPEMNLDEKIQYFLNRPLYSPPLRCMITTENHTYRGFVTNIDEGYLFFQAQRGGKKRKIEVKSIVNIQLLGL